MPDRSHRSPLRAWRATLTALTIATIVALAGCSKHSTAPRSSLPPRTFMMGFSAIPPRPVFDQLLANINLWSQRSDGAIMSDEVPWDSLLAGVPADSFVLRNQLPLAQYYRAKQLRLVVMIDPANGLNRAAESNPLVHAGRSIAEPAIQQLYRDYAVAMDTLLHPDYLGLALETNLIRVQSPSPIYNAVVQMSNAAAADIRLRDSRVPLLVSIQMEVAWGVLASGGGFVGIAQDLADFPFMQAIGLSSYPYLAGFTHPDSLPNDYYSRVALGTGLPVLVTEGGWSSETVSATATSPALQRQYMIRQAQLLDATRAVGWFQLTFTDLDLTVWPVEIAPFAHLGLVDVDLSPKPALAAWDSLFARPRQ